jgi:glucokinase
MDQQAYVIGIDIGGTKCAVTLAKPGFPGALEPFDILEKRRWPTSDFPSPEEAIPAFIRHIDELLQKHGLQVEQLIGIGISCGGPLDSKRGIVLSPPNLPGWNDVHIVEQLGSVFPVRVKLLNDANACALVEWKYGAGKGCQHMVFLTFGTGMGAGLILNGQLYEGASDMAGEIGHLRLADTGPVGFGKAGSFEGYCSGGGIARLGRMMAEERWSKGEPVGYCASADQVEDITAEGIGRAAQAGDAVAMEVFRRSGHYLGVGLSILMDTLNPEVIVIGSIFGRQYDLLWPEAKRVIEQETIPLVNEVCTITTAGMGERVGDYASLAVAMGH